MEKAIAEIKALHESDERWERYVAETQRAQAQELPDAVLLEEVRRRGYTYVRWTPEIHAEWKRMGGVVNVYFQRLPFSWERDARGE